MIKIENIVPPSNEQWKSAIMGARNPMNSWGKSDSIYSGEKFSIGENDLKLLERLVKAGTDHSKFLRFLPVTMDITAPLYWWKEADTYKVGTASNSCSTMHKIQSKEFTLEDFSIENLYNDVVDNPFKTIIDCLNFFRGLYLQNKDKDDWWQMIQLLPSSYNQRRTVIVNYAVLRNMYHARKNHKLDEWRTFCDVIRENIPYSDLICMESGNPSDAFKKCRNELKKHDELYDGFQASIMSAIFENSDISDREDAIKLSKAIADRIIGDES